MEQRNVTINGRTYSILQPPVIPAMQLSARATALAGPLIASLTAEVRTGGWLKLAQSLQAIDPEKAHCLLMDAAVISKLSFGKQPIIEPLEFERHFGQHREDVYEVLGWCLWESVRDFFPQLATFVQYLKMVGEAFLAKMKESPSPKAGR